MQVNWQSDLLVKLTNRFILYIMFDHLLSMQFDVSNGLSQCAESDFHHHIIYVVLMYVLSSII